jgi:hypothetical protein
VSSVSRAMVNELLGENYRRPRICSIGMPQASERAEGMKTGYKKVDMAWR